ncbi:MAG: ribosylnicotinamide kinase [Segetibacter sp.]|nr:ribosylnicotinamide kinase [Segetibacter sp.]
MQQVNSLTLQNNLKKIVIIGPESTGKSTLCTLLAQHYNTLWCPEFAREYLLSHGTNYTFEDLLTIAKGQLTLEDEYVEKALVHYKKQPQYIHHTAGINSPLLFIDTEMYVMKVWSEFVFGKVEPFITDQIHERKYDLYLLCNIDLPWVKDELREYPDEAPRIELYNIYKNLLTNQTTPWVDISGDYENRFNTAVKAIHNFFACQNKAKCSFF